MRGAAGREDQAGPDVVAFKIRKIGEDLRFGHALGEHLQDIGGADAKAAHAGAAAADTGSLRDANEQGVG